MAALLPVRFPDGSWEYHVPFEQVSVGDVFHLRGRGWTVASLDHGDDGRLLVSVDPTTAGGGWPGPFDEIELHAPAAERL